MLIWVVGVSAEKGGFFLALGEMYGDPPFFLFFSKGLIWFFFFT